MQKNIRHVWFLNHPLATVWESLTDPKILGEWLMENDFKPVVGHKFTFNAKPKVKIGFDGMIYCEVLEIIPLKKLSYTWKGGPRPGEISLDSVVTWTLVEKDGGTELILEHTGFKGIKSYLSYFIMNKGWDINIKKHLFTKLNDSSYVKPSR